MKEAPTKNSGQNRSTDTLLRQWLPNPARPCVRNRKRGADIAQGHPDAMLQTLVRVLTMIMESEVHARVNATRKL